MARLRAGRRSDRAPQTAYSLSKLMGEKMAEQFCRWDPALKIVGAPLLQRHWTRRITSVFAGFDAEAAAALEPVTYIDARDAAQAVRLSLRPSSAGRMWSASPRRFGHEAGRTARCSMRSIPTPSAGGRDRARVADLRSRRRAKVLGYEPHIMAAACRRKAGAKAHRYAKTG